jgi:hypothetical protein
MTGPMWKLEYQPVPNEAAIRADERAKFAATVAERDALKSQRKAVLDLCEDAVQYGWHDHIGELAADSICTDRCRNRSAWDLDPAAVRSAYGINDSPEGEER